MRERAGSSAAGSRRARGVRGRADGGGNAFRAGRGRAGAARRSGARPRGQRRERRRTARARLSGRARAPAHARSRAKRRAGRRRAGGGGALRRVCGGRRIRAAVHVGRATGRHDSALTTVNTALHPRVNPLKRVRATNRSGRGAKRHPRRMGSGRLSLNASAPCSSAGGSVSTCTHGARARRAARRPLRCHAPMYASIASCASPLSSSRMHSS